MKLPDKCPDAVIYFLAGITPITAHIHRRQLCLFGMICRLPQNILHQIASSILTSEPDTCQSWFVRIRELCSQYSLPSPLLLLQQPPTKASYKHLVNSKILDFWENALRIDAASKPSLAWFNSQLMSLLNPHPIFTSCSSNVFETNKSVCQASLLSGRYKTDYLSRHWNKDNPHGFCTLCPGMSYFDTLEHFLISCDTLQDKRNTVITYWLKTAQEDDQLRNLLVTKLRAPPHILLQFLLDPSSDPDVIQGCQHKFFSLDEIFRLTRCWCYALHRRKLQLTGRFQKL